MNREQAVQMAMEKGTGHFLKIIRANRACFLLGMEESDIISDFALHLLERNARPVFLFKGTSGASFSTYITVVFRNWLLRKLTTGKKNADMENLVPETVPDFREGVENSFHRNESNTHILTALYECINKLSKTGKQMILFILEEGMKIKEIAAIKKFELMTVYNQYYTILKVLKKCLHSKEIEWEMIEGNER